jgi:actin-related protein
LFNQAIAVSQESQDNSELKYQFSPYKYSPGVKIQIPTNESIISDWDLLERIWDHSLQNFLKTDLAGLPILTAEKPYNTPEIRHK